MSPSTLECKTLEGKTLEGKTLEGEVLEREILERETLGFETLPQVVTDPAVLAELWTSFVSLMRSHCAAMQFLGRLPHAVLSQTTATSLLLNGLERSLGLSFSLSSGQGAYELLGAGTQGEAGQWQLRPDATVVLDDHAPQDMELAVEAFVRRLSAKQPEGMHA